MTDRFPDEAIAAIDRLTECGADIMTRLVDLLVDAYARIASLEMELYLRKESDG